MVLSQATCASSSLCRHPISGTALRWAPPASVGTWAGARQVLPTRTEAPGGWGPCLSDACQGRILGGPPSPPTCLHQGTSCGSEKLPGWPGVSRVASEWSPGLPGPQRPRPGPIPKSRPQPPDRSPLLTSSQRAGVGPGPQGLVAPPPAGRGGADMSELVQPTSGVRPGVPRCRCPQGFTR